MKASTVDYPKALKHRRDRICKLFILVAISCISLSLSISARAQSQPSVDRPIHLEGVELLDPAEQDISFSIALRDVTWNCRAQWLRRLKSPNLETRLLAKQMVQELESNYREYLYQVETGGFPAPKYSPERVRKLKEFVASEDYRRDRCSHAK